MATTVPFGRRNPGTLNSPNSLKGIPEPETWSPAAPSDNPAGANSGMLPRIGNKRSMRRNKPTGDVVKDALDAASGTGDSNRLAGYSNPTSGTSRRLRKK